jgi:phospholipase C
MTSKNVLKIHDDSGALESISFEGGIDVSAREAHASTVTIQKTGTDFVVTFDCNRRMTTAVAKVFATRSGGSGHAYGGWMHSSLPEALNFTFQVKLNFKTSRGAGSVLLNVAQGNRFPHNNWWWGGPSVDSNQKILRIPLGTDGANELVIPLSGTYDSFTLNAGTIQPKFPIQHVFVLMLENHSFDNIFAMSGIPGITAANPTTDINRHAGVDYPVSRPAPVAMPTDPGHEFEDVVQQLAGAGVVYPPHGPYPEITRAGYVDNYATVPDTKAADVGKVMACFDTPTQLPVLNALARNFLLCDHWYSSMPGPTWPNRFFVHGASSSGLDHSPTLDELLKWSTVHGFVYPNGSIFDALDNAGIPYGLYNDEHSRFARRHLHIEDGGDIAQVAAIKGVSRMSVHDIGKWAEDLKGSYQPAYTFIEPNYGDVILENYRHGSSQHPMDETCGAEGLVKFVYETLRDSPVWQHSLLIITYDEHGGFYDSQPPLALPKPNDRSAPLGLSTHGFAFDLSGVRVPAIAVSPWLAAEVDHTVYDHSSVLATVEALFGLRPLTDRDRAAKSLTAKLLQSPRSDCPMKLPEPVPPAAQAPDVTAEAERFALRAAEPLPRQGNLPGVLAIALKTELELAGDDDVAQLAIRQRFEQLRTRGDARDYLAQVSAQVAAAKLQAASVREDAAPAAEQGEE